MEYDLRRTAGFVETTKPAIIGENTRPTTGSGIESGIESTWGGQYRLGPAPRRVKFAVDSINERFPLIIATLLVFFEGGFAARVTARWVSLVIVLRG
jgi:hypothetical protein